MNAAVPNGASVLASLAAAADAARQVYLVALEGNPAADLSALYAKEIAAQTAWSSATAKALGPNPAVTVAQLSLDAATAGIRKDLKTVTDIAQWVSRLDSLVQLATKVAGYFLK